MISPIDSHLNTDISAQGVDTEDEEKEIDLSWIERFESLDKEYSSFYQEDLTSISFHAIYINRRSEITKTVKQVVPLSCPNMILRDELLHLIKHYNVVDRIKYSVLSILTFNITIHNHQLLSFLKSNIAPLEIGKDYLAPSFHIHNIPLQKSIHLFHDINELFILFYESVPRPQTCLTKRIRLGLNKRHTRKQTIVSLDTGV
jgi:hypothetical protein